MIDDPLELLSEEARAVLRKAQKTPLSYGVRMYTAPPGTRPRVLVVLGEAHIKLGAASSLGKEIVRCFSLRGIETFQVKKAFMGRALWAVIHLPRLALRTVTLGFVKGSTIVDAKEVPAGTTVEIEKTEHMPLSLHVASAYLTVFFGAFWAHFLLLMVGIPLPMLTALLALFELHMLLIVPAILLRKHAWSWVLHPAVAILTVRDTIMAEGIARMMKEHEEPSTAIAIMGRAHLPGVERELVEKHGFTKINV